MSQYPTGGYQPQQPQQPAATPAPSAYSAPQPGYSAPQASAAYSAPYGAAGQPQYAAAATAPSKGLSITALIIGIASILGFSWTGLVPIAGIVLGIMGMKKEPAGKTMAMWGMILSIASIVFTIIGLIVIVLSGGAILAALFPMLFYTY